MPIVGGEGGTGVGEELCEGVPGQVSNIVVEDPGPERSKMQGAGGEVFKEFD
jgi:hypothetical protein